MRTVDITSAETSYFFNVASLFNAARRNGVPVLEYVDEIEGIALNTESALLRARAHALLEQAAADLTARPNQ